MSRQILLSEVKDFLAARLVKPLPGHAAHDIMRAKPNGSVIPQFNHKLPPKPGSVIILLTEQQHEIVFPLIKRPTYAGTHSGQISLPGGKAEEGENEIDTALREGFEEIGVPASYVDVVGKLSEFFVVPSNFMVTPIVGVLKQPFDFVKDDREVERILTCSLKELLDVNAQKEKEILAAGRYAMWAPHFEIDNEIVWGATAMMLNELRTILKEVF
jgi:8-oxo-dGTP pyrophosphatase MutT (NUDIX family)